MPKGQEWVFSDTLGLLRDRQGDIHLTTSTRRYPQVTELFTRWLTDRLPKEAADFKFTSISVNCNYAARQHRDNGNFGPSFIGALGEFTGGELNYWPEDAGGSLESVPRERKVALDIKNGLALFNGNCAHEVEDFTGERYSLVFFAVGCHAGISGEDRVKMDQLGFRYPAIDEDPHALLRPPRGYSDTQQMTLGAAKTPSRDDAPAFRFWKTEELQYKGQKNTTTAVKRRLSPENAKSFYGAAQRRQKYGGTAEAAASAGAPEA